MTEIDCPECNGKGGGKDHFGEWDDCQCCEGTGKATASRVAQWKAEIAAIDAEINRITSTPCARCGVMIADCKCGEHWRPAEE